MALTEINSLGIKDGEVKTADLAADAVTGAKIADDAIDSEHYTDGSIDTAHIAADQITGALIADDAVGAEHIEQLDNNLQFADSCHAKFGTDNDLAVYHDGYNANIINTTGDLYIEDSSGNVIIRAKGSENSIICHDDGAVELYHDNSKKFETTASGISVTGGATFTGDVTFDNQSNAGRDIRWDESVDSLEFDDNTKATFGADGDLQIKHDGTNSSIKNSTGDLYIEDTGGNIYIQAKAGEKSIDCFGDGAVDLYHDNTKKL